MGVLVASRMGTLFARLVVIIGIIFAHCMNGGGVGKPPPAVPYRLDGTFPRKKDLESKLQQKKTEEEQLEDEIFEKQRQIAELKSKMVAGPGIIKRLLISALAVSDRAVIDTIIGTKHNFHELYQDKMSRKGITAPVQSLADRVILEPMLTAYGKFALGQYKNVRDGYIIDMNEQHNVDLDAPFPSFDELLSEDVPSIERPMKRNFVERQGSNLAFGLGVRYTRKTLNEMTAEREKIFNMRREELCNKLPGCFGRPVNSMIAKIDSEVINKMDLAARKAAETVLKGFACKNGIDCDVKKLLENKDKLL